MRQYIPDADDTVRLLYTDGAAELIELYGEGRMLFFTLDSVRGVKTVRDLRGEDALCFSAEDPLLGERFLLYLPKSHGNYDAFRAELLKALQLSELPEEAYAAPSCDQNGHHG